jgi:alkaline phosphatase
VASVLEAAKLHGRAVGLVVTSRVSHATPAAFGSHIQDRDLENDIMEQLVYQDMDVVFGGGAGYLVPRGATYTTTFGAAWQGLRSDRENLLDVLKDRGCQVVDDKEHLTALKQGPVWGLFSDSHLDPQMDKAPDSTQPSLAEMTAKAIEILSGHPDGFFLMVEGSQVDWGGHGNDPAYMVTEYLAFDAAVGRALAFAKADGHTSVYIWPDHNTGGLSIGNAATFFYPGFGSADDRRPVYTATPIESLVAPLKKMKISAAALARRISDPDDDARIKAALAAYWGIQATDEDLRQIATLKALKTDSGHSLGLAYALSEVISRNHLIVGWTSHGHVGEDVPVWSYGPQRLVGTFDNTELASLTAGTLGLDLAQATGRLFVDLATVFPGFSVDASDRANPVIRIGPDIVLPVNKDILVIGGRTQRLSGIVVYAPKAGAGAGKVFIPRDAVELIRKSRGL